MPSNFLSYWKPSTADAMLQSDNQLLPHAASDQYGRVDRGDTVWIVTARTGGQLVLLGRILVDVRTDQATAARLLSADDLWKASHHVLAAPDHTEVAREVDLADLAAALRFESDKDRLAVNGNRVDPKQLQSMRRLTPASADLLRRRWSEEADYAAALAGVRDGQTGGVGFGTAASNREVERAAIAYATSQLEADDWEVTSVESECIGFDLLCTTGTEELHVEVKGTRTAVANFIITEGELRRMRADPQFRLHVVTEALSDSPRLHVFTSVTATERYEFVPLAYRAIEVEVRSGESDPPE